MTWKNRRVKQKSQVEFFDFLIEFAATSVLLLMCVSQSASVGLDERRRAVRAQHGDSDQDSASDTNCSHYQLAAR